ncbi:transcriptional regulator [Staphylococcus epidermidis]|nr:transcriptional regulator [Staphylococcus epidermidis]
MRLRKETINYLESELRNYKYIDRDIERLNNKIIYSFQFKEKATLKNKQLKQLNKMKEAIENVYKTCSFDNRQFMEKYYFNNSEKLNVSGVAYKTNISKSTAYNLRNNILISLSDELGILH